MDFCKQFPLSGHVFFCRQLHVLVALVFSGVALVELCKFRMRLLWLSMVCLVLFMQL